jgi:hypothetical protein
MGLAFLCDLSKIYLANLSPFNYFLIINMTTMTTITTNNSKLTCSPCASDDKGELLSDCCGAAPHRLHNHVSEDLIGLCGQCGEWSSFTYEGDW